MFGETKKHPNAVYLICSKTNLLNVRVLLNARSHQIQLPGQIQEAGIGLRDEVIA